MSTVAVVIGGLSSPALYVSGFVAEVFSDSGHTAKVASMACGSQQLYNNLGSTTVNQASVTPGITPQSVVVASLTAGSGTIAAGSFLLVGSGATQEVVEVISAASSQVTAVFSQAHVSGDTVSLLSGNEPGGVWIQSSLMVAKGLTASTTYYLAAGPTTSGGAVNWSFTSFTTAASGTSFAGTFSQTSGGVTTYTLTATSPPGDLTHYEAYFVASANAPTSGTTPSWTGTGTSLTIATGAFSAALRLTVFVRAVGTSGNYPWVLVDQRVITAGASSGSVSTTLGVTLDKLVPFVSGMDSTFPTPDTIYNPSFEAGNVGWTLQTNWGIGQGHACFGNWSAYIAGTSTSPLVTSSSLLNTYHFPMTPGSFYYAQCLIDGTSAGVGNVLSPGYAAAQIIFYNASNVVISVSYGNFVYFGGLGWNLSRIEAAAPAGTSYGLIGVIVNNQETGTVFVDDFEANAVAPALVDVPDGPVFIKLANVGPDHNIHVSTALNPQGSVLPNQPIPLGYDITDVQITVTCNPVSLLRADGSLLSVVGGSITYSSLTASTTYYTYPYINVVDGTLQFSNANPPGTTPSLTQAMQANYDGRIPIGTLTVTTLATGGTPTHGTGGGSVTCPEADELVDVFGKGQIIAGDVIAGDLILGKSFSTGKDLYRRVIQSHKALSASWYVVDGHRCSPTEPIFWAEAWVLAFRVPGAVFDKYRGYKAMISVESDEYDEQNYYLVGPSDKLLIHNIFTGGTASPC
jgi:hypothetical protein